MNPEKTPNPATNKPAGATRASTTPKWTYRVGQSYPAKLWNLTCVDTDTMRKVVILRADFDQKAAMKFSVGEQIDIGETKHYVMAWEKERGVLTAMEWKRAIDCRKGKTKDRG